MDKLLYILFSILMENNIFNVFFFIEIFVKNFRNHFKNKKNWWKKWSWVLQIFDPRWLNNPVRLNAKVNSTEKKIQCIDSFSMVYYGLQSIDSSQHVDSSVDYRFIKTCYDPSPNWKHVTHLLDVLRFECPSC